LELADIFVWKVTAGQTNRQIFNLDCSNNANSHQDEPFRSSVILSYIFPFMGRGTNRPKTNFGSCE